MNLSKEDFERLRVAAGMGSKRAMAALDKWADELIHERATSDAPKPLQRHRQSRARGREDRR